MLDDALKQQKKNANQKYGILVKGLGIALALIVVVLVGNVLLSSSNEPNLPTQDSVSNEYSGLQNEQARDLFRRSLTDFDSDFTSAMQSEALARWAPDELGQTKTAYDKAVNDFAKGNYIDALNAIESAQRQAESLVSRWDQAFEQLLDQATVAFNQDDSRKAGLYLSQALKLKPTDDKALNLEQRLSKLPDIEQLLEDARVAKTENSLEREAIALRQIVALDPQRTELIGRLADVEEAMKRADFQGYISRGMKALSEERIAEAQNALNLAKGLYPNSQEINVLERELSSKTATNQRHVWKREIDQSVTRDNWKQVLTIAQTAKQRFPTDKQFSDYETLATDILARTERIDRYLAQPERLKDSGIHANASDFAKASKTQANSSFTLTVKLEQLKALLETFNEPVPITVRSDGKTNIIVIGQGKVGLVEEKVIELKAGNYVLEGSRAGYRNVRVRLKVDPSIENQAVTVVCNERI